MKSVIHFNKRVAVVVPEEALLQKGLVHYVYVIEEKVGNKARAKLREIKIGMRKPGTVEIVSGLMEGDEIIARGFLPIQSIIEVEIANVLSLQEFDVNQYRCEIV